MAAARSPKSAVNHERKASPSTEDSGRSRRDGPKKQLLSGCEGRVLDGPDTASAAPESSGPKLQVSGWLRKLEKVLASDISLQPFLEAVLPIVVNHFGALGGLIWLRPHGGHGSWFALRHQIEPITFGEAEGRKHERLVQFAWQQRHPLLVAPKSKSVGQPGNPVNYSLAFAPVIHLGETVALLELVFRADEVVVVPAMKRSLLHTLQIASENLHLGLRSRLNLPAATMAQATVAVEQLKDEIRSYEESLRRSMEARLQQFQGWSFGSLAENQAFARMVHELLDQHGLRVRCPECGHPAILRCIKAGNSRFGVFVFDHYLPTGRTFHGGPTTVPVLYLIPKPHRRVNLPAS